MNCGGTADLRASAGLGGGELGLNPERLRGDIPFFFRMAACGPRPLGNGFGVLLNMSVLLMGNSGGRSRTDHRKGYEPF